MSDQQKADNMSGKKKKKKSDHFPCIGDWALHNQ